MNVFQYGASTLIRTERTAPFERADFTNLSIEALTGSLFTCYHYTTVVTNLLPGFEPGPSFFQKDYLKLLKRT